MSFRTRGTHNDTVTLASDSSSVFSAVSFTTVNIAPFGDHSEYSCCRVMSRLVRADQIPSDMVSSHRCSRPGMNLISETGDPIKVVWIFGVRREPASQRDASRYVHDCPRTTVMRQSSEKGAALENPRGIDAEKKGDWMARARQRA